MINNKIKNRTILIFSLLSVFIAGFIALLFYYQVINPQNYVAVSAVSQYKVKVDARRGEILDKNGNALVYNDLINTLVFNKLDFPADNKNINNVLYNLIKYLTATEEAWIDALPLVYNEEGQLVYKEKSESDIKWLKSSEMCDVNDYATAENCLNVLIEKYELQNYPKKTARNIASVRYNMDKMNFSTSNPYTFATNIKITTICYIEENCDIFIGVNGDVTSERKYSGNGRTAAHILGVIGAISAEEYSEQKKIQEEATLLAKNDSVKLEQIDCKAYSLNDVIGKNGIEQAMENHLRGVKGVKTLSIDTSNKISESFSLLPNGGNNVFLTLDKNLQEIAAKSLEKRILEVTDEEALQKGFVPAGAVVVQDVNTGAVLASASYPDFSLTTYYDDYSKLLEDPGKPLWNRAFQSTYSPGSTMKPVIAIAALEEGIINSSSVVYCQGQYKFIDQTFACFNKVAHGGINVEKALQHSCNIFFFEMAKELGIVKMNTYSSLFGLGQKTGIEISESEGILAGIEYRDSIGQGWKIGETLLAAIGQSDNAFSPIQLTNYCSTIANGGIRYTPYLVEKIMNSDFTQTIFEHSPQIAVNTNISEATINTVKKGMYLVANEGSCQYYLGNLSEKVACKTGTAEKTIIINGNVVEGTDGFLIAFGPYENSEIAITVVIENAGSGSSTAQVAADIFEYYFTTRNAKDYMQSENAVLW